MSATLVIGNGESRSNINIKEFSKDYVSIGCNAIHRETTVDHLVCCDRRMVEEAVVSDNTSRTSIYVRPDWFHYFRKIKKDKRIIQVPNIPYKQINKQDDPIQWGSGPYAVLLGASMDTTVMLLGFDLYGTDNKINNVYKGTPNYKDSDSSAVDPAYWIYQIGKVFQSFPNTEFVIWNNQSWELPKAWRRSNVCLEKL